MLTAADARAEDRQANGLAESTNASIGRLRTNARSFPDPDAFITMIMLNRGGLGPDLPLGQRILIHESVSCLRSMRD